jgi:hypothetical protein
MGHNLEKLLPVLSRQKNLRGVPITFPSDITIKSFAFEYNNSLSDVTRDPNFMNTNRIFILLIATFQKSAVKYLRIKTLYFIV